MGTTGRSRHESNIIEEQKKIIEDEQNEKYNESKNIEEHKKLTEDGQNEKNNESRNIDEHRKLIEDGQNEKNSGDEGKGKGCGFIMVEPIFVLYALGRISGYLII